MSYQNQAMEHLLWKAESSIDRFLRNREPLMEITGSDSLAMLSALLSLPKIRWQERPHLIVTPTQKQAEQLSGALNFFDPDATTQVLSPFDVGIYSGLHPNRKIGAQRLGWLWRAQRATAGELFVASVESLLQKTLPFGILRAQNLSLKKNDGLPDDFVDRLQSWGYISTPIVEDLGAFSVRGGIVDVYSPAHSQPVRMELFGDIIDSIRFFDPETQRSGEELARFDVIPAQEILFTDESRQRAARLFKASIEARPELSKSHLEQEDAALYLQSLAQGHYQQSMEFLISAFYEEPGQPLQHFNTPVQFWKLDPIEIARQADELLRVSQQEFENSAHQLVRPDFNDVYVGYEDLEIFPDSQEVWLSKVKVTDTPSAILPLTSSDLKEVAASCRALGGQASTMAEYLEKKIKEWKNLGHAVFFATGTQSQAQRLKLILEKAGATPLIVGEEDYSWQSWTEAQGLDRALVHVIPRFAAESLRVSDEHFVLLKDEDLFGQRRAKRSSKSSAGMDQRAHALNFGDLKPGDFIVHKLHGIGVYEGLKVMPIQGIESEFIQIKYKGNDRLYLPVYRVNQIQKYSGPSAAGLVDKLGGPGWERAKTKVRSHLRDVASELLDIYAKRAASHRPPYSPPDEDYLSFEAAFPYDETDDQLRAINDIVDDLQKETPMDRLVCGDVGFGKTEVAMRAAFKVIQAHKQVAVIAPTTVLTFQHLETFKNRFAKWPIEIRSLNRFVSKKEATETLKDLREGRVDLVIGTHRLLSKDVQFKDLGLLIIDEEQRFGVKHKERLRKFRASLDTLAMSATPIPRTLNLSLVGIRDLSLINTAPVDRLPTRTFVMKFDKDTIRKAVTSEIARGGQVYFIHNRVQSIYALADELKELLPEVRFKVAHGQMEEGALEKVMVEFFHHEIDMLLCTTIVESGMDIPKANTMFIDNAQQLGLSQLYQLRGRVGRSKERAYCHLIIPAHQRIEKIAQERLKILQENSALGSGVRIAQYDLELRGAGDILGEEQAGHINAVGYELYLELLEDAVRQAKGEESKASEVDPEINVRIPALIPDQYIPDIRVRLAYYKALSEIETAEDLDRIEDELRDQFGKPPEPVLNLMGLMLIRKLCKDLAVRDLSGGKSSVSLSFTEHTPLATTKVVELASRPNKKYSVTPDYRLNIRMNEITWPRIMDELNYLKSLV